MKLICSTCLTALCLLLSGCFSSDDDGYGNYISTLSIQDAITLTNEKQYVVGDTIFFELKFSRYVKEEGFPNLLDIYETTNDTQFGYSFGLLKFSEFSNNYSHVSIDPKFIIAPKAPNDFYYYDGYSTVASINAAKDAYVSNVGIILAEEGAFKFDFDNIYIRNGYGYNNDKIHLDISHRFSEGNTIDVEFSVTEE